MLDIGINAAKRENHYRPKSCHRRNRWYMAPAASLRSSNEALTLYAHGIHCSDREASFRPGIMPVFCAMQRMKPRIAIILRGYRIHQCALFSSRPFYWKPGRLADHSIYLMTSSRNEIISKVLASRKRGAHRVKMDGLHHHGPSCLSARGRPERNRHRHENHTRAVGCAPYRANNTGNKNQREFHGISAPDRRDMASGHSIQRCQQPFTQQRHCFDSHREH